ncbi:MAG: transposase [Chloroflexi bacterium]|nr:transposase [Chloroflexota bacterium]
MLDQVIHTRNQVALEGVQLPDARYDHDQRKAISIDGGMVNIRAAGWKEIKVGAVFDVESRLQRDPHTQDWVEMAHGVAVHYTAVLGTKDEFQPALWALAFAHDIPTARQCSVVADGALWIWDVADQVCPHAQGVVDWFHAVEHLSQAAHQLYPNPDDSPQRQRWLKRYKDHLYTGRIQLIIAALHRRHAPQLATYFERYAQHMQYMTFREAGLPIGSGTVESGVKQFKQRLCGTGMRWNKINADQMIVIRTAILADTFDALWDAVA